MRLQILERDGWRCRKCASTDIELHVHHKYYAGWKDPWECDPKTLIALCKDCHEEEESCKEQQMEVIHALLDAGFYNNDFDYWAALFSSAFKSADRSMLEDLFIYLTHDGFRVILEKFLSDYHESHIVMKHSNPVDPIDDLPF